MAASLSPDLRIRVIRAVEGGLSRTAAAKRFGISPASAVRWMQSYRQTGRTRAKPCGGDRRSHRIEAQAALLLRASRRRPTAPSPNSAPVCSPSGGSVSRSSGGGALPALGNGAMAKYEFSLILPGPLELTDWQTWPQSGLRVAGCDSSTPWHLEWRHGRRSGLPGVCGRPARPHAGARREVIRHPLCHRQCRIGQTGLSGGACRDGG